MMRALKRHEDLTAMISKAALGFVGRVDGVNRIGERA